MTIGERDRREFLAKMMSACWNNVSYFVPDTEWVVIKIRSHRKGRHWLYYDKPHFLVSDHSKIVFRTSEASYSKLIDEEI